MRCEGERALGTGTGTGRDGWDQDWDRDGDHGTVTHSRHTQRVKGLAEGPPPVRQPSAMGRAQGGGNGGLEGTAEGDLWQVGCPGRGGVGCFNAAFPYSTAMQAWGTRPVPSPRHWSPELSLVVWLWVQPEKRQCWGLALPKPGRSMRGQG